MAVGYNPSMTTRTNRIPAAAAALVALVVALAAVSCNSSSTGPTDARQLEGRAAAGESDRSVLAAVAAAADAGERLPDRRTQYLPPREALAHRLYALESTDLRGQSMVRLWRGKVQAGIGDEIWSWQQADAGHVFQGEALLRGGRVVDGYILRAVPVGPADAGPARVPPATPPAAVTPATVTPATGPAAATPPTTQP